jgi:hypothetical protein
MAASDENDGPVAPAEPTPVADDASATDAEVEGAESVENAGSAERAATGGSPPERWMPLLWLAEVVLGLVVCSAPLVARSWWGDRAWWLLGLGALIVFFAGAMAWRPRDRSLPVLVVQLAIVATGVAAMAMRRIGQGESPPGEEYLVTRFERLKASDIPPVGAYTVTLASVLLVVIGSALTVLAGREGAPPSLLTGRRMSVRGLAAVTTAAAFLAGSVTAFGSGVRVVVDGQANARLVSRTVTRPAERIEPSSGPAHVEQVAWEAPAPDPDAPDEVLTTGIAVPGWDAVVTLGDRRDGPDPDRRSGWESPPVAVVARAKTDGSELWTYQRHDLGQYYGLAIDPDAGRVLLLVSGAVIVLDLRDGSQEVVRTLPDDLAGAGVVEDGSFPYPLGGNYMASVGPDMVVAELWQEGTIAVLDVASGEVRDRYDADIGCTVRAVADPDPASSTDGPVITQWGPGDGCGTQTLLRLDADGRFVANAVEAPDGAGRVDRLDALLCDRCQAIQLLARGDLTVVETSDDEHIYGADVVALSPGGEVLWRASETTDTEDPNPYTDPLAITDRGVVVRADDTWRLLDAQDGSEIATSPMCEGAGSTAADAERLYVHCTDGTAVIDLDTLDVSMEEHPVEWSVAWPSDGHLVALTWHDAADRIVSLTP